MVVSRQIVRKQHRKMKKLLIGLGVAAIVAGGTCRADATESYYGFDEYGGFWHDAEKTPSNTEDDLMCWAAAGANILAWTGWGRNFENDADRIFKEYQDYWTDNGGHTYYGWEWWFNGENDQQGVAGWSQLDQNPSGGAFYEDYQYSDYVHHSSDDSMAMNIVDEYLHAGYGTTLSIYTENGGHAISVWGYEYDEFGNYVGIYITDSDNSKLSDDPVDSLNYVDVLFDDAADKLFLQDYYNTNDWYIGGITALDRAPVPEPITMLLFGTGLATLVVFRGKRKKTLG